MKLHVPVRLSVAALFCVAATGQSTAGQTWQVGPQHKIKSIAAASLLAKSGDMVEVEPGTYRGDVAVWNQDKITIRAKGSGAKLLAAGAHAEGKGTWVVKGGQVTVENFEFVGSRVPDGNGAGIRLENGQLTVRKSKFTDNQNGILTAHGPITLTIEDSEFSHNGAGDGRTHSIYVGGIRELHIKGSFFHHANGGHLIKSRAAVNYIYYNKIADGAGGEAGYELDLPNGGLAYVLGNSIQQTSTTTNTNIISFGVEGYKHAQNELYLANNTIVDDRENKGNILLLEPGADKVVLINNLLVTPLTFFEWPWQGLRTSVKAWAKQVAKNWLKVGSTASDKKPSKETLILQANNINVDWSVFSNAFKSDYRLLPSALPDAVWQSPNKWSAVPLIPTHEFTPLLGVGPVKTTSVPGAFQSRGQ